MSEDLSPMKKKKMERHRKKEEKNAIEVGIKAAVAMKAVEEEKAPDPVAKALESRRVKFQTTASVEFGDFESLNTMTGLRGKEIRRRERPSAWLITALILFRFFDAIVGLSRAAFSWLPLFGRLLVSVSASLVMAEKYVAHFFEIGEVVLVRLGRDGRFAEAKNPHVETLRLLLGDRATVVLAVAVGYMVGMFGIPIFVSYVIVVSYLISGYFGVREKREWLVTPQQDVTFDEPEGDVRIGYHRPTDLVLQDCGLRVVELCVVGGIGSPGFKVERVILSKALASDLEMMHLGGSSAPPTLDTLCASARRTSCHNIPAFAEARVAADRVYGPPTPTGASTSSARPDGVMVRSDAASIVRNTAMYVFDKLMVEHWVTANF